MVSLYLHIPFCSQVCHYCDFAKTSHFTTELAVKYLDLLCTHFRLLRPYVTKPFSSLYLGGGTPGIFAGEYQALMSVVMPDVATGAEVTLEANPHNVTPDALKVWRDLGMNRLSIGVQTLHARGLRVLTRDHTAESARRAVDLALKEFSNVSLDLIYGWQGQSSDEWSADLDFAVTCGVPHVSCYTLTYEPRTPLGRAHLRRDAGDDSERLAEFYTLACERFASSGFVQEEVSNWGRQGFAPVHNAGYWQGYGYLGLGAGAHGYLPDAHVGLRYSGPREYRNLLRAAHPFRANDIAATLSELGYHIETERSMDDWILEMLGSGLRTARGIDLQFIMTHARKSFAPSGIISEGMKRGLLVRREARLCLAESEWFREAAWAAELAQCLKG